MVALRLWWRHLQHAELQLRGLARRSAGDQVRVTVVNDNGGAAHYWHMADQATFNSFVNPSLAVNQWVPMGQWLGWQGNATGIGFVLLHLHFTMGTRTDRDCCMSESMDPTPWVGPNLRHGSPDQYRQKWYEENAP
jgi:hypothetical protein